MISIKDRSVLASVLMAEFDEKLIDILIWLDEFSPGRICITSGYRSGDEGVHDTNPCRGVDIRSWVFTNPQRICDWINERYEYDYDRPRRMCAILHNTGYGMHIHIQVHPHTRIRDGKDVT